MSPAELPRAKILVVDDLPANLLAMRRLLAKVDADLFEVHSGIDALAASLDHEFALVLLDVNMPEMDGFEVASLLGEEPKNRLTPIIFVTAAYADDINRMRGYEFGAVDYIAKPINDKILTSKVQVFLDLWLGKQELRLLNETLKDRNQRLEAEVAERLRAEAQVRHLAQHDLLTGLPNRMLFLDRLDTAIARTTRNRSRFALLYIDIDGFKQVNDALGHAAGDELLQQIAERLLGSVRRTDTVARLGGDEFAVILDEAASLEQAQQFGHALCETLAKAYALVGQPEPQTVQVSASIGASLCPDHTVDRRLLLAVADDAMYAAKKAGKNQCRPAPPMLPPIEVVSG